MRICFWAFLLLMMMPADNFLPSLRPGVALPRARHTKQPLRDSMMALPLLWATRLPTSVAHLRLLRSQPLPACTL